MAGGMSRADAVKKLSPLFFSQLLSEDVRADHEMDKEALIAAPMTFRSVFFWKMWEQLIIEYPSFMNPPQRLEKSLSQVTFGLRDPGVCGATMCPFLAVPHRTSRDRYPLSSPPLGFSTLFHVEELRPLPLFDFFSDSIRFCGTLCGVSSSNLEVTCSSALEHGLYLLWLLFWFFIFVDQIFSPSYACLCYPSVGFSTHFLFRVITSAFSFAFF